MLQQPSGSSLHRCGSNKLFSKRASICTDGIFKVKSLDLVVWKNGLRNNLSDY